MDMRAVAKRQIRQLEMELRMLYQNSSCYLHLSW